MGQTAVTVGEILQSSRETGLAERQQPMTSEKLLRELYSPKQEQRELYGQVLLVIGEVENTKQLHMSQEERKALAINLVNLGESIERIMERARFVKRNRDYKRIPFDVWIDAEPLYTLSEAIEIAEQKQGSIQRRKQLAQNQTPAQQAERLAQRQAEIESERRLQQYRDQVQETIKRRTKRAERFLKTCSDDIKTEVAVILNAKGKLGDDPHWKQILPYFAPHIIDEVEEIMQRYADNKPTHKN